MRYSPKNYAVALYEELRSVKDGEFSARVKTFLRMLKKNNALKLLPPILKEIEKISGGKSVEVSSAKVLSGKARAELEELFGGKYAIKEKTASELLGGMVLMWDDWRVDGSVRGKFEKLRTRISE